MGRFEVPAPDATEALWMSWAEGLDSSVVLNLRCEAISPERAILRLEECPWPINPNGAVHGGFIAGFADQCLGIMAARVTEPGSYPTTASLTAHYLRPAIPPLTFEATIDRAGRKLVFITVSVLNGAGEVAAVVLGCMSVLRPRVGGERSLAEF